MKRILESSELLDRFLELHEDDYNYETNQENFEKVYDILDKYANYPSEDVDVTFPRAPESEQRRMIALLSGDPKKKLMHHLYEGDIGAEDIVVELFNYVDDSDVVDILSRLGLYGR